MIRRWIRRLIAAAIPTLIALAVQEIFFGSTARWVLFYPAVFAAAWFGGFIAGVLAAALSALALVWLVMPPTHTWYISAADAVMGSTFFGMSVVMSGMQNRLRRIAAERLTFAALIDNSSDFIAISDPSGKPIYLNPAGRRMVGMEPGASVADTDIYDYYAPEDRDFARDVITPEAERQGHWQGETRFVDRKTGQAFPVWHNSIFIRDPKTGEYLGRGTITRDITEQKHVEDELRRREADLRDAERIAHLGSWSWDLETDAVHWSDELHRMFHHGPRNPMAKLFDEGEHIFLPESVTKIRAAVANLLATGEPYELELEAKLPGGKILTVSAQAEAVRDESGRIVRINGTALDITELKNLERLRDEWMSFVAHDLRQPIGFITMAASTLKDVHEGAMSDEERELTTRIAAAGRSMARMVDDLLAASLVEAHRLELEQQWMNPRALVEEAVARIRHLTEERPIHISQSEGLRDVYVDPMRIGQILGNLISNAVKYGHPKTPIDIHIEQHEATVEISVTNSGPGISAEDIPRLFQRFARSAKDKSTKVRGLGVGLYIAKALVDAHHGHIKCESTPGKTTTFRVTLPAREASSRAA